MTMFSGVRQAIHQSSSVVLMLASRCGSNGGTNMKSPGLISTNSE